eukprot:CAMPEP_0202789858 /NCGR_PEP_ID=MMETSP1388-20130828/78233_1 /ASSEMBLY_ACC=CAM_ASM_000864 /TAXON_ID=37098 /ORGANISM="Isochrysis sp, Strain CCMP1244" /LENGTH=51 /DNA_ID=CAMNT_0049459559 /DNA_START=58 /DNA_END=209 /DNA_ORIENTATION=-
MAHRPAVSTPAPRGSEPAARAPHARRRARPAVLARLCPQQRQLLERNLERR